MTKTDIFRDSLGRNTFKRKYALNEDDTWEQLAHRLVDDVCGTMGGTRQRILSKEECEILEHEVIGPMKFIPGGRYLYYAGRPAHFWNNCFVFKGQADTREEWARICHDAMSALSCGGGIGVDYSVFRPAGRLLSRTGGTASGPIPLALAVNEIGRQVMQGGSRRSALYGSLSREHEDVWAWLHAKDWKTMKVPGTEKTVWDLKAADFNYPAPFDMTNISVNYSDEWLGLPNRHEDPIFVDNVHQALTSAEPGFSFNFGPQRYHTGRNACTEFISDDDSDVCNLGSINLSRISSLGELHRICRIAAKFLICGSMRADLPHERIKTVRDRNRRIGMGLMGVGEWLLQRGLEYGPDPLLGEWLKVWAEATKEGANEHCDRFYLNRPKAYMAVAPAGTIAMLAGTSSGIEPVYACAYKRRYLVGGTAWKYQLTVDATAQQMLDQGVDRDLLERSTALALAATPRKRLELQALVQDHTDMGISSTVNLPAWGTELNNEDRVSNFAQLISEFAPRLRGLTFYPDGCRGGQPLTQVPLSEAEGKEGIVYEENTSCAGGVCGV